MAAIQAQIERIDRETRACELIHREAKEFTERITRIMEANAISCDGEIKKEMKALRKHMKDKCDCINAMIEERRLCEQGNSDVEMKFRKWAIDGCVDQIIENLDEIMCETPKGRRIIAELLTELLRDILIGAAPHRFVDLVWYDHTGGSHTSIILCHAISSAIERGNTLPHILIKTMQFALTHAEHPSMGMQPYKVAVISSIKSSIADLRRKHGDKITPYLIDCKLDKIESDK